MDRAVCNNHGVPSQFPVNFPNYILQQKALLTVTELNHPKDLPSHTMGLEKIWSCLHESEIKKVEQTGTSLHKVNEIRFFCAKDPSEVLQSLQDRTLGSKFDVMQCQAPYYIQFSDELELYCVSVLSGYILYLANLPPSGN